MRRVAGFKKRSQEVGARAPARRAPGCVPLQGKETLQVCLRLRTLRLEVTLDYSGEPSVITKVPTRGKQEGQTERLEDATLQAWETGRGAGQRGRLWELGSREHS